LIFYFSYYFFYSITQIKTFSLSLPPFVLLFSADILDETIISEDPTPAETSNQKNRKIIQQQQQHQQSQMIILAALIAAAGIIITSIVVAGCVAICRIRRPKPPEPEEVRKRIR
jgi:tellurite resistance protein TehA-like permease